MIETNNIASIDRIAPTLRPAGRSVMRQRWAELLFLHWEVAPERIRPLLPPGLELDTFEGRAYIGLVPFTMTGVRPVWTPSFPPLSDFHETNVRTYVHRQGLDPGVWFFSLDAANAVAVRVARTFWKLPYHFARMQLVKQTQANEATVENVKAGETLGPMISYATERLWPGPVPAGCRVRYTPTGIVELAQAGKLEHFLAERYILYTYSGGRLWSGRVHHSPYPLQTAAVQMLEENLIAAAGIERPDVAPLAHYAGEVRVHIFPLRRL